MGKMRFDSGSTVGVEPREQITNGRLPRTAQKVALKIRLGKSLELRCENLKEKRL